MACHGLLYTLWSAAAGDGDPWEVGRKRQLAREDEGQTMVVADTGSGAEAVLIGHPMILDDDPDDFPDEFRSILELERMTPDAWYLSVIATLPEARRRGHGRRLMETAETLARTGGFPEISLITLDRNPEAIAMYQAFGYAERARRPILTGRWEAPGSKWILMVKGC